MKTISLLSCTACRQQHIAELAKSQIAFSVKHYCMSPVTVWICGGFHLWDTHTNTQTHTHTLAQTCAYTQTNLPA